MKGTAMRLILPLVLSMFMFPLTVSAATVNLTDGTTQHLAINTGTNVVAGTFDMSLFPLGEIYLGIADPNGALNDQSGILNLNLGVSPLFSNIATIELVQFANGPGGLNFLNTSGTLAASGGLSYDFSMDFSGGVVDQTIGLFFYDAFGGAVSGFGLIDVTGGYTVAAVGPPVSPVPLPAAGLLMLFGVGALGLVGRRKRRSEVMA